MSDNQPIDVAVLMGSPSDWDTMKHASAMLDELGVAYTPATETAIGTVIVFRDPDNIQLEFWLPAG